MAKRPPCPKYPVQRFYGSKAILALYYYTK